MANKKPIIITLVISAALILLLAHYENIRNNAKEDILLDSEVSLDSPLVPEEQEVSNPEITNTMNPTAIITTNKGSFELELFEDQMPITAGNFISLAESGFYDGTKFHRVIDGFMIQGGDPNSKSDNVATYGTGGSENIQDEFVEGELLTNTRGTIAMANTGQPNSGSSQFFINLGDNSALDYDNMLQPNSKHPVFGRVTSGMDVIDEIARVETQLNPGGEKSLPVEPVVVESVKVVRN